MIVILHATSQRATSEQIRRDFDTAFKNAVPITFADASSPGNWPADVSWDDLLLIVYDGTAFPDAGNKYIQDYLDARNGKGRLLSSQATAPLLGDSCRCARTAGRIEHEVTGVSVPLLDRAIWCRAGVA